MRRLLILALYGAAMAQTITPNTPQAVNCGGSQNFSFSVGTGPTCTVTGQGTCSISGSTLTYTPPATCINVPDQSRGVQELPINSPYFIPVQSLPLDPHSSRWITRAAEDGVQYPIPYHNVKIYSQSTGIYGNPVTNSTPEQLMHCYYVGSCTGTQDTDFPIPTDRVMETCSWCDSVAGYDRHLVTLNKDSGSEAEIYNLYIDFRTVSFTNGNPTHVSWTTNSSWVPNQRYQVFITCGTGTCPGAWAGASNGGTGWRMTVTGNTSGTLPFDSSTWGTPPGNIQMQSDSPSSGQLCPLCNTQGAQKFSSGSYAQNGGVDAAGMPISPLTLKMEEWYAKTRRGDTDLGHAMRTTLSNSYISARNIWPATSYAYSVAGFQNFPVSCTAANPTVCTASASIAGSQPCDNYTYTAGCTFYVNFSGLTGTWITMNGDQTATAIDNTHFSLAFNSTGFGTCTPTNGNCYGTGTGTSYFVLDFFPYGALIRLKSSVNVNSILAAAGCTSFTDYTSWCAYARTYLNTLQDYGMYLTDGTVPSDNWDNGVSGSEFHPNVLLDAAYNIRYLAGLQPFESYIEVANISGKQLSNQGSTWLQTPNNRTYVTVTGSSGSASADILLQGTTIGTDQERLIMAANLSYQLNVWERGNVNATLNYAIDSGIPGATVSATGLVTMPNCLTAARGTVTVSHSTDANALPLYIGVACLPVSSDGSYRVTVGNYTGNYTDTHNFVWWGAWANYGFNNSYEAPMMWWANQDGTWPGYSSCSADTQWNSVVDQQLYNRSTQFEGDNRMFVALPEGTYNVTFNGEPGFGGFGSGNHCGTSAGTNVFDLVLNNQVAYSWQDGYVLAGNQSYAPYTLLAQATVGSNRLLGVVQHERVISTYGPSASSLLITPTSAAPLSFLTTSPLPNATINVPYSFSFAAAGGTPPYTFSLASGSFPTGLGIVASGLVSGTPTATGTSTPTVQVCDSVPTCISAPFSITVNGTPSGPSIQVPSFTLPVGTVSQAYLTHLAGTGGTLPYTWCILETTGSCDNGLHVLPAGLLLTQSGNIAIISGTPQVVGISRFSVRLTDANGLPATLNTAISVTQGSGPPVGGSGFTLNGSFMGSGNVIFITH